MTRRFSVWIISLLSFPLLRFSRYCFCSPARITFMILTYRGRRRRHIYFARRVVVSKLHRVFHTVLCQLRRTWLISWRPENNLRHFSAKDTSALCSLRERERERDVRVSSIKSSLRTVYLFISDNSV